MNLDELLKIAEAATPGPWYANDRMVSSRPTGSGDVAVAQPDHKAEYANAAHIAAFNPRTAQALVKVAMALVDVRKIIAEGAMEGFNPKAGDWAERLFASQGNTSNALTNLRAATQQAERAEAEFGPVNLNNVEMDKLP